MFIVLLLLPALATAQRIAVIGGGISGTFVARYLTDYDPSCKLDLTLYDPSPLGEYTTRSSSIEGQGSRVATLQLDDGRLVEIGASILSEKFRFIQEMAIAGNLSMIPPFQTGVDEPGLNTGFLIYDGTKTPRFSTANMTSAERKYSIALRYNIEAYLVTRAMHDVISRFESAQTFLADDKSVFSSPQEMWKAVGLESLTQISLAEYCKSLWVPEQLSWWRSLLYNQGSLQEELLSAINLVNYNQDNRAINALTGLASFSVVSVPSYGIEGGNIRLVASAWDQAQQKHCSSCPEDCTPMKHVQSRVSTIVGSLEGFELFGDSGALLGKYDLVILATPMSMSKIDFLIQSHIDDSVLQPMPLGRLIENKEDSRMPDDHEGHAVLPGIVPPSVSRSYTPVVTTIVRGGILQTNYFSIPEDLVPRSIYMTVHGKATTYNVTAISQMSASEGIYKVFSSMPLSTEVLTEFFGNGVRIEFEKVWGGRHGGATPDYQGSGESTEFLLYDGATGFHGHTKAGALYYTNALEHSLSCMESSAMGAKAVAKLIAKRLEWITHSKQDYAFGDEL
jgi:prenylcysteine oxidase/farnesylcysteine lyase